MRFFLLPFLLFAGCCERDILGDCKARGPGHHYLTIEELTGAGSHGNFNGDVVRHERPPKP